MTDIEEHTSATDLNKTAPWKMAIVDSSEIGTLESIAQNLKAVTDFSHCHYTPWSGQIWREIASGSLLLIVRNGPHCAVIAEDIESGRLLVIGENEFYHGTTTHDYLGHLSDLEKRDLKTIEKMRLNNFKEGLKDLAKIPE